MVDSLIDFDWCPRRHSGAEALSSGSTRTHVSSFVRVCVGLTLLIRFDVNAGPQQMGMRERRGEQPFFSPLVLPPVFLPEPHGSCQSQDFHVKLGCLQNPRLGFGPRKKPESCLLQRSALTRQMARPQRMGNKWITQWCGRQRFYGFRVSATVRLGHIQVNQRTLVSFFKGLLKGFCRAVFLNSSLGDPPPRMF